MSINVVIQKVSESYCVKISSKKAYWARRIAKEKVQGNYAKQYNKLWDYANEVRRSQPDSMLLLLTEPSAYGSGELFMRFYMCHVVKQGFLQACRPIIGLDDCFLKTPFGGILLVAMGQDPNDQYYPLNVVVVESENKDSWKWFLQNLLNDIGHEQKWVFISDQQKV